jgi:hypothetical protein
MLKSVRNDGRFKQDLVAEMEKHGESIDDICLLRGKQGGGWVNIDPSYLDGERYSRFAQHVAYTPDRIYYTRRLTNFGARRDKWGVESKSAGPATGRIPDPI